MIPSTKSVGRVALILCIYPILAIHAFASSPAPISTLSRVVLPRSSIGRCNEDKQKILNTSSSLHLHMNIPRGGAAVASATVEGIVKKLSAWTSTPTTAFNLALGVLAASTAVLKLYGAAGKKDDGDETNSVRLFALFPIRCTIGEYYVSQFIIIWAMADQKPKSKVSSNTFPVGILVATNG